MYLSPQGDKIIPGRGSSRYKGNKGSEKTAKQPVGWSTGVDGKTDRDEVGEKNSQGKS